MTFLAPIPMLVAGILGGLAMLSFYLLKLRRRPVRVSSTMLWEQARRDLEVNVPLRWLRASWMLLLHLLILALLVGAIGRPAIDGPGTAGSRIIFLLDRSASMNARDGSGGGSRLDQAKQRITELVRAKRRDRVRPEYTLIALGAEPIVVGPPTRDAREVRRQLGLIKPTDQPGDLPAAMRLAETLARPSDASEDAPPRRPLVVLVSDGGGLPTPDDPPMPLAGAGFAFERVGPWPDAPRTNAGITAISATRDPDRPNIARVFVRLAHTRAEQRAYGISVLVGGDVIDQLAMRLPSGDRDRPGSAVRTIAVDLPSRALVTVRLDADENDALEADDSASIVVPSPRRPGVLLVAPQVDGRVAPDPFLLDVLEAFGPQPLRSVSHGTYTPFARAPEGFDLVIFDRVEADVLPPVPSLHFGARIAGVTQGEPGRPRPGSDQSTTRVASWDRAHPALAPVTLDSLVVAQRIDLPESSAQAQRYEVLAAGGDGPLIVEFEGGGARRLVVGFELAQSNWPVQVSFPVFVAAALEHLAPVGVGSPGRSRTTGDPGFARVARGSVDFENDPPVNLADAEESAIAVRDEARVAGTGAAGPGGAPAGRRELWAWLIAAAFVLLLVEWLVYALLVRV